MASACDCPSGFGDCGGPPITRKTLVANITIQGFRQFVPWPTAGTVAISISGSVVSSSAWSKTNWAAGEILQPRVTGNGFDLGVQVCQARIAMSPAPDPQFNFLTGQGITDGNWQFFTLNASPTLEPNKSWPAVAYDITAAYPAGSLVNSGGHAYIAGQDADPGDAPPSATWQAWSIGFNFDQTNPRQFRSWTEHVEWNMPDGPYRTDPATGTYEVAATKITYANRQTNTGPSGAAPTFPEPTGALAGSYLFWQYMVVPRWGDFGGFFILDSYTRSETEIVAVWLQVTTFHGVADGDGVNTFTQTITLGDEFDPAAEWTTWAEYALGAANFADVTDLKEFLARIASDGTVFVQQAVAFGFPLGAGVTADRGVNLLRKLQIRLTGDCCQYFHPSPSGAVECTQIHAGAGATVTINPPASNGSITITFACTCAP